MSWRNTASEITKNKRKEMIMANRSAYDRQYYQLNREKKLEYQREYYQRNKDKMLAYQRGYYHNRVKREREKFFSNV